MDDIVRGSVVRARAGRDKGGFFVVLSCDEVYAIICDGRSRPLCKPKRKKLMHLARSNAVLDMEAINTDREIRRALSGFIAGGGAHARGDLLQGEV